MLCAFFLREMLGRMGGGKHGVSLDNDHHHHLPFNIYIWRRTHPNLYCSFVAYIGPNLTIYIVPKTLNIMLMDEMSERKDRENISLLVLHGALGHSLCSHHKPIDFSSKPP